MGWDPLEYYIAFLGEIGDGCLEFCWGSLLLVTGGFPALTYTLTRRPLVYRQNSLSTVDAAVSGVTLKPASINVI